MEKRDEEYNLWSKVGTKKDMAQLIEGEGAFTGCVKVDQGELDQTEIANAHLAMQELRERCIEGHVVIESDSTRYEFMPETDLIYPPAVDKEMPAFGKMTIWWSSL